MTFVDSSVLLFKNLFFIIVGLIGINFLIAFHELGHFLFCKLFNIKTPSFSIGFGPRLLQKKIGDTIFAFSAIPLGGYVEIAGAQEVGQGEQQEAQYTGKRSFAVKPYYQKLLVLLGGIIFNLLFAYVALVVLFSLGIPKTPLLYPYNALPIVDQIVKDSPAEKAGLTAGDTIIRINQRPINQNVASLLQEVRTRPNEHITLTIERSGQQQIIPATLATQPTDQATGFLGIIFEQQSLAATPFLTSLRHAWATTNYLIAQTFKAFTGIFTKRSINNLGGPLMVISQTIKGAEQGFKIFLLLLAFISINLAVLNLIPLPILDGGQVLFYTLEALAGRPLPDSIKIAIHYACWIGILALMFYLSYRDIRLFING